MTPEEVAALRARHVCVQEPDNDHFYCDPDDCNRAGEGSLVPVCATFGESWPCDATVALAALADAQARADAAEQQSARILASNGEWSRANADLQRRLDAVRALHVSDGSDTDWCLGCSYSYPCATVDALDGTAPEVTP